MATAMHLYGVLLLLVVAAATAMHLSSALLLPVVVATVMDPLIVREEADLIKIGCADAAS